MRKFYIIENNGGGIEMFVTAEDGNHFEGWFANYEFNGVRLGYDIGNIILGDDNIMMWEHNFIWEFDSQDEACHEINRILEDTDNNTVIAEYDGDAYTIYPARMSSLALEIFGMGVE